MKKIVSLYSDNFYKKRASECFNNGVRLISENRYEESNRAFKEASELDETNGEYHFYAGLTGYFMNHIEESSKFLGKAYRCNPENLEYASTYGISLYRKKDYETAITILKEVVRVDSNYQDANLYLGRSYYKNGELEKAVYSFQIGTSIKSDKKAEFLFELGCVYMDLHEYDKSKQALLDCISVREKYPIAYYYLSKVYLKTAKHDQAIECLLLLRDRCPEEAKLVDKQITGIEMLKSL